MIIVLFYLFEWMIPDFQNNEISIIFNSSVSMDFVIGAAAGDILVSFDDASIDYYYIDDSKHSSNENLFNLAVKQAVDEYIFVFYNNKLNRIDIKNYNGVGVILPKNYYH